MDNRIVEARQTLKMELIDTAVERAIEMLPGQITDEDNQKFIDAFISNASSKTWSGDQAVNPPAADISMIQVRK